jgi:rod shape-determining protein MreD
MIAGRYLSVPLFLIAAVLQTALLPQFQIRSGRVDIVLLLVLSWSLLAGPEEGLLWAIVAGVLQDLASNQTLGSSALALVCVAWLAGRFGEQIGKLPLLASPIVAAVTTGVYHLLLIGIYLVLGRAVPIVDSLLQVTLPTMLLNAVFILPVYRIMRIFFRAPSTRRITVE